MLSWFLVTLYTGMQMQLDNALLTNSSLSNTDVTGQLYRLMLAQYEEYWHKGAVGRPTVVIMLCKNSLFAHSLHCNICGIACFILPWKLTDELP
jgi:hypothetical protein